MGELIVIKARLQNITKDPVMVSNSFYDSFDEMMSTYGGPWDRRGGPSFGLLLVEQIKWGTLRQEAAEIPSGAVKQQECKVKLGGGKSLERTFLILNDSYFDVALSDLLCTAREIASPVNEILGVPALTTLMTFCEILEEHLSYHCDRSTYLFLPPGKYEITIYFANGKLLHTGRVKEPEPSPNRARDQRKIVRASSDRVKEVWKDVPTADVSEELISNTVTLEIEENKPEAQE